MKASEWANMDPLPTAPPFVLEALRVRELADKALQQASSAKPPCDEITAVHVQLELPIAGKLSCDTSQEVGNPEFENHITRQRSWLTTIQNHQMEMKTAKKSL